MRARLGDIIDDYCVKCKRIMNHSVVSCLNDEPAKVRCRTCHGDHDYRHEQAPPTKADLRKAALFKEVADRAGLVSSSEETPAEIAAEVVAPVETVETAPAKTKRAKARK
jgi:hypothetical protein